MQRLRCAKLPFAVIVRHLTNDQPKVLGSLERLGKVRAALG
jgi:hypothetical protein